MKQCMSAHLWWLLLWRALLNNPVMSFLIVFIGLPAATLLGVAAAVYAVMLPISRLMGWM